MSFTRNQRNLNDKNRDFFRFTVHALNLNDKNHTFSRVDILVLLWISALHYCQTVAPTLSSNPSTAEN